MKLSVTILAAALLLASCAPRIVFVPERGNSTQRVWKTRNELRRDIRSLKCESRNANCHKPKHQHRYGCN
jgi:hypothetical protein